MEKIFAEYNSEILENTIGEIGVNFFESSNIERYISLVKCIKDRNA